MSPATYLRIVRASAFYDLIVTTPFALAPTARWNLDLLRSLQVNLGLAGTFPEFEPGHLMFVGLMGSLVTVWSLLRLWRPRVEQGLFNGFGRVAFSGWMIWLLAGGGPGVVWLFLVPEVAWGAVQLLPYPRLAKA